MLANDRLSTNRGNPNHSKSAGCGKLSGFSPESVKMDIDQIPIYNIYW
jgi:hypothetical protein